MLKKIAKKWLNAHETGWFIAGEPGGSMLAGIYSTFDTLLIEPVFARSATACQSFFGMGSPVISLVCPTVLELIFKFFKSKQTCLCIFLHRLSSLLFLMITNVSIIYGSIHARLPKGHDCVYTTDLIDE